MKHHLRRLISEADSVVALGIAITMSVLGLFSVTSGTLTTNAILATLAILAISTFRDRWRRDATAEDLSTKLTELLNRTENMDGTSRSVRVLRGSAIGQAFADAYQSTDRWTFKGGTGTYIRAVILPECHRISRAKRRQLKVQLEILDPSDGTVCESYATFRASMADPSDQTSEKWSQLRTQEEAYATILAACWYDRHDVQLHIQVGLSRKMSTFRYDMSASSLIITQDDSTLSLLIPRDSDFYDRFDGELARSFEQAVMVDLKKTGDLPLTTKSPTTEDVGRIFDALDLPLPRGVDPQRIIRRAFYSENPYPQQAGDHYVVDAR